MTRGKRPGPAIVVSNRLPVKLHWRGEVWEAEQGGGGLVQALEPMLRRQGGTWVGWPNVSEGEDPGWRGALKAAGDERGIQQKPVILTDDEVRDFYGGFSNEVLWPLFHNLDDHCHFKPGYYEAYVSANRRFAAAVAEEAQPDSFIWVHDYQLISVAAELRDLSVDNSIGFFLHIPFPPLESFLKLPWRAQILAALLAYDVVGFQSERDRLNFLDCIERLKPDALVAEDAEDRALTDVTTEQRVTRVGTFPIGIDFPKVVRIARSDAVERRTLELKVTLGDKAVLLGVDRLDYTKGIQQRLLAFEELLATNPELIERVHFVQVVQPSRTTVPEYQELKREIDRLVGAINGRFSTPGWVPVHYIYRGVEWTDLFALYRIARVAVITPLKDGMNLVAKEYCAVQVDEPGALVLSEFAGAAAQMHEDAIVTNPYDVEGTAAALREALSLPLDERRERMKRLAAGTRQEDVFWWTRRFLTAVGGDDVSYVEAYLPALDYDRPIQDGEPAPDIERDAGHRAAEG